MRSGLVILLMALVVSACGDRDQNAAADTQSGPQTQDISSSRPEQDSPADVSIYQLASEWTNQLGKPVALEDLGGSVQVVAMVFTNCQYACPRLTSDMQAIESQLSAEEASGTRFTLFSFDDERDTPAVLQAYARKENLDSTRWTLLHGKPDDIRELAMVLGVKYNKLDDGSFGHSNIITVLDTDGAIVHQEDGLGIEPEKSLEAIRGALRRLQKSP